MRLSKSRQRKLSAASGIFSIVIVLSILIVINLIVLKHDVQKDVTGNQRFTLAPQTINVLNNLESPVEALSFVRETDAAFEQTIDLLEQYDHASTDFTFVKVDLNKDPLLSDKYGVNSYQTIVLTQNSSYLKVTEPTEHAITNTLVRLTQGDEKKTVYFTRGNGELNLDSMESGGLGHLKMTLNNANYRTEQLSLLSQQAIPDDCDILAIMGPVENPTLESIGVIERYLESGGRVLMALEPGSGSIFKTMLINQGIFVDENVIIDPKGYQNIFQPVIESWEPHEITSEFELGLVLHVASSVVPETSKTSPWQILSLGKTNEDTWLEKNLEKLANEVPEFDPENDNRGSVSFAVAGEKNQSDSSDQTAGSRIVVIGDADFVSNTFFTTFAAHEPFIMNAFHWLADEKELIAIPPKQRMSQPLLLQKEQILVGFLVPVLIVPLIIALSGTIRIIARRRKA